MLPACTLACVCTAGRTQAQLWSISNKLCLRPVDTSSLPRRTRVYRPNFVLRTAHECFKLTTKFTLLGKYIRKQYLSKMVLDYLISCDPITRLCALRGRQNIHRRDIPATLDCGFDHGDTLLIKRLRMSKRTLQRIVAFVGKPILNKAFNHWRAATIVHYYRLRPARYTVQTQSAWPSTSTAVITSQFICEEETALNNVLHG